MTRSIVDLIMVAAVMIAPFMVFGVIGNYMRQTRNDRMMAEQTQHANNAAMLQILMTMARPQIASPVSKPVSKKSNSSEENSSDVNVLDDGGYQLYDSSPKFNEALPAANSASSVTRTKTEVQNFGWFLLKVVAITIAIVFILKAI